MPTIEERAQTLRRHGHSQEAVAAILGVTVGEVAANTADPAVTIPPPDSGGGGGTSIIEVPVIDSDGEDIAAIEAATLLCEDSTFITVLVHTSSLVGTAGMWAAFLFEDGEFSVSQVIYTATAGEVSPDMEFSFWCPAGMAVAVGFIGDMEHWGYATGVVGTEPTTPGSFTVLPTLPLPMLGFSQAILDEVSASTEATSTVPVAFATIAFASGPKTITLNEAGEIVFPTPDAGQADIWLCQFVIKCNGIGAPDSTVICNWPNGDVESLKATETDGVFFGARQFLMVQAITGEDQALTLPSLNVYQPNATDGGGAGLDTIDYNFEAFVTHLNSATV